MDLRVTRLYATGFVASTLLNIVLSSLLLCLFPLKTVEPVFLEVKPKGDQIVRVEPMVLETSTQHVVIEAFLRRYIFLRETLDFQTEEDRWKELSFLHSEEVQKIFEAFMNPNKNKESPYEKRFQQKAKRGVRVLSIVKISDLTWMAEWESDDFKDLEKGETKRWSSTFTLTFEPQTLRREDRFMNPFGIIIQDYFINERTTQ